MVKSEVVNYQNFKGYLSYNPELKKKLPIVLITPTWMGLNDFARKKSEEIANLGYLGFVVDLFGEGKEAKDRREAKELTAPFVENDKLILERLKLAMETALKHPAADPSQKAAIGFCFGGTAVLEYVKSGADLQGAVSFHGSLERLSDLPFAEKIPASLLILHGYNDPFAPEEDLLELQESLSTNGVDFQTIIYGDAMHAFTNPKAQQPELGLQYHEKTAHRAWQAMENFLQELFNP